MKKKTTPPVFVVIIVVKLHYLWSINCINVCIRGYNCCQTGIELSKCVYLASVGVKINHIVGGQNHFFFFFKMHIWWSYQSKHRPQPKENCEKLCFCPSKLNSIHGQLNKIEFGCKFYRISHLGILPAIVIAALSVFSAWHYDQQTVRWHVRKKNISTRRHSWTVLYKHWWAEWGFCWWHVDSSVLWHIDLFLLCLWKGLIITRVLFWTCKLFKSFYKWQIEKQLFRPFYDKLGTLTGPKHSSS